ncbi:hypothetical protein TNCV_3183151 [Trichonephila clavipes]|uniref:Transposase n=1 Tax=Trichonephila clavipes TaxID=2585209 RepID=A0A8X6SCN4_TRICX|nr:hypothetical protein TNCV_3183151 [Trichonephila clavipes]
MRTILRKSLSSDCRRQLLLLLIENIRKRTDNMQYFGPVWPHAPTNGTKYIDEVLLPYVRLFRGAVGDKFVFMDDNATCHRTNCLDSESIQRLVSSAFSRSKPL